MALLSFQLNLLSEHIIPWKNCQLPLYELTLCLILNIWSHSLAVIEIKGHEFQVVLGHSDRYRVTSHIASLSLLAADRQTNQLNLLLVLSSQLTSLSLLTFLPFFCF